jgi:hypothetical protein
MSIRRILLAGAAGVGTASARIVARRRFAGLVVADCGQPGGRAGADRLRAWTAVGVPGPEALPARPFLDLLADYGSPWACGERTPTGK